MNFNVAIAISIVAVSNFQCLVPLWSWVGTPTEQQRREAGGDGDLEPLLRHLSLLSQRLMPCLVTLTALRYLVTDQITNWRGRDWQALSD